MRKLFLSFKLFGAFLFCSMQVFSQHQQLQNFRPNNQRGINQFETTKTDTVSFSHLAVRVGGNFEQSFQSLRDRNTAAAATAPGISGNVNSLIPLTNGFDLAMANLSIDAQLADGIRVSLTTYLASRHHEDTWVKGGYVQFDKLLFLHSALVDKLMERLTIKVGQFDVDYGDQHYRRTDGGNTIYNPFVENYIMDEFATEIGGELYYHSPDGFFGMAGISNGELNPTAVAPVKIDSATGRTNHYSAAIHAKLGFDRQLNTHLRLRLTGSFYWDHSAANNTLFGGDRTGSHYFYVMENQNVANASTLSNEVDYSPFSGRFNPAFTQSVKTFMINPFVKYYGLEFFGTFERAQGRTIVEPAQRSVTQFATDLVYRFPKDKETFWVGARYNMLTSQMQLAQPDINIHRAVASAGWFITQNIMLKAEYVHQEYLHYPTANILNGGEFKGWMAEASIAF